MFIANLTKNVIDIINNIDIIYIYCMIVSLTEIWNLFPYGKIIFPEDIARGKCDFSGGKKSSYFPNVHAENYSERQTSTMYVEF